MIGFIFIGIPIICIIALIIMGCSGSGSSRGELLAVQRGSHLAAHAGEAAVLYDE